MVYRPTVRYDDLFKEYVDQVFKCSTLDRNQIIRLALFAAPFSPLFNAQMKKHMTSLPPAPLWEVTDHGLWMDREFKKEEKGRGVNGNQEEIFNNGKSNEGIELCEIPRQEGKVCSERKIIKQSGGITIKLG